MPLTSLPSDPAVIEQRVADLLGRMTLEEKIGQMAQVNAGGGHIPDQLRDALQAGVIGSVLNEVHVGTVNELQRIAITESRLGIPLLIGRDVIHGFKTVFPIPLGQAASWHPELITLGARIAAQEAASAGINWTFAPMIDIGRDPRWGRVAECLGEDPYLTGILGAAMIRGFQGDDLAAPGSIAACAKHFAGYGASESGRDYNTTSLPENELRNVHLPPFRAAVDAGVATLMTSFSDLNGIPASGNEWLLKQVLREEWGFDGFVVSDWESVRQLAVHGLTANDRESAFEAAHAGVDMEMVSTTYAEHLAALVREGRIPEPWIDRLVGNILRVKFRLGIFEHPYTDPGAFPAIANPQHLEAARQAALESVVLLKNRDGVLPLSRERVTHLAVIGPLADEPWEQLGTWTFDGDGQYSVTPLKALQSLLGEVAVRYERGLPTTRSRDRGGFAEAVHLAERADAVVLFLGEEAILSGEAHCRADISLPGIQEELIGVIAATGTPVILVVQAGRPLAMERIEGQVAAILYAWHPGSMGGPAIADLLFGVATPCAKLPVTFPRVTGQIPIYYAQKNTGKPATPESFIHIDDIAPNLPQLSVGNTSFHLDVAYTPLFPFGHGLSYTSFEYANIRAGTAAINRHQAIDISADVTNTGGREAIEVVQLYLRDPAASLTRPVKELKGFARVRLAPGERQTVTFTLTAADLAFHGRDMRLRAEPGAFQVWIGGSSDTQLSTRFELVEES